MGLKERIMRFFGLHTHGPTARTIYPELPDHDVISAALYDAGERQKEAAEKSQRLSLDLIEQSEEIRDTLGGLIRRMEHERRQ